MRVIYALLAVGMLRLSRLSLAQSERLHLDGDRAFKRARKRLQQAEALAARADLPSAASVQ